MSIQARLSTAPMQDVRYENKRFFIKRDDLLNQHFSGNKARKFSYLLEGSSLTVQTIVSYGSVQANSLYSLAALAQLKGWQFNYYIHHIPQWLKENPIGNYAGALALGANIIEVAELSDNLESYVQNIALSFNQTTLLVPEGGRCQQAKIGIEQLAQEIRSYCQTNNITKPLIMLPSGTGTTSLFLQAALPYQVLTCACVGGDEYLRAQFTELEPNSTLWPTILPTKKKYHFGKLYPEFYQQWLQLNQQTGIEFDLLYDPLGWLSLLDYLNKHSSHQEVIYIHQGGLIGNTSMLPRYQRKFG